MEKNDTKTTQRVEQPKGSWPESGIIYCEKEDCWCGNIDTSNGSCKASRCPIHDEKYIQEQEQRRERLQQLHQQELNRKEREKKDPPAPIRRQSKTKEELLQEKITSKKRLVNRYYRRGKPKKAVQVDLEVHRLERELKENV